MLKRLTAWLLIISVLTVNYSRLFVYAGFKLNQSYIAANLCENRNKPQMHCDGKCYLMKKLKQVEEKEKSTERENLKNSFQEAYYSSQSPVKFYTHLIQVISIPNNRIDLPTGGNAIFRPPQLG